jgi:hypothetical protein
MPQPTVGNAEASTEKSRRSGWGPEPDPDPEMPKHTDYRWWHAPSLEAVIRILAARPSALAGGHSASRCGGGQLARAEIAVPDFAPGAAGLKTGRLCRSFSCRCGVRGTGGLTPIHSQPRGDGLSPQQLRRGARVAYRLASRRPGITRSASKRHPHYQGSQRRRVQHRPSTTTEIARRINTACRSTGGYSPPCRQPPHGLRFPRGWIVPSAAMCRTFPEGARSLLATGPAAATRV